MRINHDHAMQRWALVTAIALPLATGSLSCSLRAYSGAIHAITVGVPPLEQNALLYVADERGFLARYGLDVTIKDYDSGVTSLEALLQGEVDIAEAAEFPVVATILRGEQVSIIASNDRFENDYIVARRDRGITGSSDLAGKRIGVTLGTINEFHLGRFLQLNGLELDDVTVVDLKPAQYLDAIAGGAVDALIAWQPYVHEIEQALRGLVVWPAQSNQAVYGVLVCNRAWLSQHTAVVERLLRALADAEDELVRHPDAAQTLVQKRLNYDDGYMAAVWPQHRFSLSLDFSLIVAMYAEARWMADHQLADVQTIPDIADYIHVDGLNMVRPEAVNIAR